MSFLANHFKEIESKLNDMLYENIVLLTYSHPPTKEFKEVFNREMFMKNNKAAFFEVVHYLLNLLNPELTKQRLTMWPPYDIKRENKFRTELLKYINELNTLYPHADIPPIMASHLISPGGIKIIKFMLKLSQVLMFEELLKVNENSNILYSVKPSKNETNMKTIIHNLSINTEHIQQETNKIRKDFTDRMKVAKEEAQSIVKQQKELSMDIAKAKEKYASIKKEFDKNYSPYPSLELLNSKKQALIKEIEYINETIYHNSREVERLQHSFLSDDRVLKHNKKDLKVPKEILHIVNNCETLDLQQYFYGLEVLLEKRSLDLPIPTTSFLKKFKECIDRDIVELQKLNENLSEEVERQTIASEQGRTMFNREETKLRRVSSLYHLAVPLLDSN